MDTCKDRILAAIEAQARRRIATCSRHLSGARPADLELIRAELSYECWLAENCREARRA